MATLKGFGGERSQRYVVSFLSHHSKGTYNLHYLFLLSLTLVTRQKLSLSAFFDVTVSSIFPCCTLKEVTMCSQHLRMGSYVLPPLGCSI